MPSPTVPAHAERFENVTNPFDGMLGDDLVVERSAKGLTILENGDAAARAGFERKLPKSSPAIKGKPVDLSEAIAAAARLIGKAKLPLYGGLATDVEGIRAVLALAERTAGVVDHALSEALYRNLKILQTAGWITSTLTETRNRADLVIIAGSDIAKFNPRFFERIVSPPDSMFDVTAKKRTLVFIGKGLDRALGKDIRVGKVITLPCKAEDAGEVVATLRAQLRGFRIEHRKIAGVPLAEIDALAERCKSAKYGVVAWAPPSLDYPHAEFAIDQFAGLVKDLNQHTRFAGLSLGGAEGSVTAGAVCSWQSGYPLRLSYLTGAPDYDPYRYSIHRMLADGEGDALLWIASFSPDLAPPKTKIPAVVLGTPGLNLVQTPAVFIPVGTPGLDHAGRLLRVDNVVALPLKDLGRAPLPRAADIVAAIEAAL